MSDTLLASKIHIPTLRSHLVNRSNLIQRLNDGITHNHRLILISAPAGYGKSTLLSEWVSQLTLPLAWLSLESSENSPSRFWNYFIAALLTISSLQKTKAGEWLSQVLKSQRYPSIEDLLINLINEFTKLDQRVVLVLDDLHFIKETQIHQNLAYLIDHLPSSINTLQVVVASRMDPPWPLARWRAREELTELRPVDLRFSHTETDQLLNEVLQLGLTTSDINAIQDRTEGWIAGLQLAAISIQGRLKTQGLTGVSHFIETFTGSNRFILDYLMEEVISQQSEEIRNFLIETSILEHLSPSLCDALLRRNDSQSILDQLEQANLFLIPLDDERQWYRYHHLMADLLRKQLKQAPSDHIIELHQRACDWFAENNILSAAIRHALDAGDVLRVNELISGNALNMVEHAELFDVLRHFEEIPFEQISSKPWLIAAFAWVKAYTNPSGEVEENLLQAEQIFSDVTNPMEKQNLMSHLAAIRAYVAWVIGKPEKSLVFASQALRNLPEDDWRTRAHLLNIEGLAHQYNLDLSNAHRSFEAATIIGQKSEKPHATTFAYNNLAYNYFLQGHLYHAFSICQNLLAKASQLSQGSTRLPVFAYGYATQSLVQLEWNELPAALASAQQSVTLAEQWNQADTLHYSVNCLSKCLFAAGHIAEAFATNQRAMQLALNVSPWFFRISALGEIEFNIFIGDLSSAIQRYKETSPLFEDNVRNSTFKVIKTALLFAQEKYSEVIQEVESLISEYELKENFRTLLKLRLYQALALHALGEREASLTVMKRCLDFCEPEGYVRIFVDLGIPMLNLLLVSARQGIHPQYIYKLLPAFEISQISPKPVPQTSQSKVGYSARQEPLSDREIQVLRLLDSPLTNKEISSKLYVSVNTVRTHVRNIYAKLGVKKRSDAVWRAKELNLI